MAMLEFFKRHNFFAHPFSTFFADVEPALPEWFVAPPFLQDIIGDTGQPSGQLTPRSNLIFGRPGSGKTALRRMMERDLLKRLSDGLVISYADFTNPLSVAPRPSLLDHMEEVLRLGTAALIAFWSEHPDRYARLGPNEKKDLAGLVDKYWDNLPPETKESYHKRSPLGFRAFAVAKHNLALAVEGYNAVISVLKKEKIERANWTLGSRDAKDRGSPYLRMQRFWALARAMGVTSIWILVDGVDDAPNTRTPETIFDLIADIVLAQPLLEFKEGDHQVICFKVFLTRPDELEPKLAEAGFRKDRIEVETISWTRKDLATMLSRRLAHFTNKRIVHFDELCAPDAAGTHDRLLDSCDLRPRTLFRMGNEILSAFQKRDDTTADLLDRQSIEEGIGLALKSVVG